jgi:cell division protein ZipA
MELREWLIILGLVLVTIIVVDGVRRLQRQRKVPRLDQVDRGVGDDDVATSDPEEAARQEEINWELPNGGARVVRPATQPTVAPKPKLQRQDHPGPSKVFSRMAKEQETRTTASRTSSGPAKSAASASRDDYPVRGEAATASREAPIRAERPESTEPRATDVRKAEARETRHDTPVNEPDEAPTGRFNRAGMAAALRSSSQRAMSKMSSAFHRHDEEEHPPHREPSLGEPAQGSQEKTSEMESAVAAREAFEEPKVRHAEFEAPAFEPPFEPVGHHGHAMAGEDEAYADVDFDTTADTSNDVVTPHPVVEKARRHNVSAQRARETLASADEVIVISVLARNEEGFSGTALLNLMLACGLRYSEMGIFLRYETEDDESELQFAMVDVVKPGTFDLEAMDDFSTPGVTFLMPLPGAQDSAAAFEAMVETAMVVVRNLGGELKDENRSVMTAQTVEFARQRVQEFERRNRLHRYQAN